MSIEELEHTADLRFRIRSPSLEGLFAEAARALMETLYGDLSGPVPPRCGRSRSAPPTARPCSTTSSRRSSTSPRPRTWSSPATDLAISDGPPLSVRGTLRGTPFDPARHAGGTEVKGIAYFDLSIVEADGGYRLEIVFDV